MSASLTPSEAYAAAALFALSLRETLAEARADGGAAAACGVQGSGGEGVWLAGGLAQRVFADLGVPSRAWLVRRRVAAAFWRAPCAPIASFAASSGLRLRVFPCRCRRA